MILDLKNVNLAEKVEKKIPEKIHVSKVIEDKIKMIHQPTPNNRNPYVQREEDLTNLTKFIHNGNEMVHKYLRRNKPQIRLNEIEPFPSSYSLPTGFTLIRDYFQKKVKENNLNNNPVTEGNR